MPCCRNGSYRTSQFFYSSPPSCGPPWVPPNIEIISGNAALLWWRSLALGTGSNGVLESFHLAFYWDNGGKCANSAITSTWKRWCDSSALLLFYCFFLSLPYFYPSVLIRGFKSKRICGFITYSELDRNDLILYLEYQVLGHGVVLH